MTTRPRPNQRRRRSFSATWLCAALSASWLTGAAAPAPDAADAAATGSPNPPLEEVSITATRLELLGTAVSASEGVVTDEELQLDACLPAGPVAGDRARADRDAAQRRGQGESVPDARLQPGSRHGSGDFVDGMPINQPTHAHGQGYTDLNFMIPELADAITYTKGPYYADVGDFGAVGSVRMDYRDTIADQVAVDRRHVRFSAAASPPARKASAAGSCWRRPRLQHYDGPFDTPDDARKENAVLRYSAGR